MRLQFRDGCGLAGAHEGQGVFDRGIGQDSVTQVQNMSQAAGLLDSLTGGASDGFLRAQDLQNGANLKATEKAWPRTVAFLKKHLEF